jgi:hypothetical protein
VTFKDADVAEPCVLASGVPHYRHRKHLASKLVGTQHGFYLIFIIVNKFYEPLLRVTLPRSCDMFSFSPAMRNILLRTVFATLLSLPGLSASSAPYTVTSLGLVTPLKINNEGEILAEAQGGNYVLYQGDQVRNIPNPPGGYFFPKGLNDSGQIVGLLQLPNTPGSSPFTSYVGLYSGGTFTALINLSALGPEFNSSPSTINNAGQIAGNILLGVGSTPFAGFLYSQGTFTEFPNVYYISPNGLNANGSFAGTTGSGGVVYQNGSLTPLPALVASASAINDSGQVTGETLTGEVYLYDNGQMQILGSPGNLSFVTAINNTGSIVGTTDQPFVYTSTTGFADLADLVDPQWASMLSSSVVAGINNSGQIITYGGRSGDPGLLLTPVPEPASFSIEFFGLVLLACRLLRFAR